MGEVKVLMTYNGEKEHGSISRGERVAQMVLQCFRPGPFQFVHYLPYTERGTNAGYNVYNGESCLTSDPNSWDNTTPAEWNKENIPPSTHSSPIKTKGKKKKNGKVKDMPEGESQSEQEDKEEELCRDCALNALLGIFFEKKLTDYSSSPRDESSGKGTDEPDCL